MKNEAIKILNELTINSKSRPFNKMTERTEDIEISLSLLSDDLESIPLPEKLTNEELDTVEELIRILNK